MQHRSRAAALGIGLTALLVSWAGTATATPTTTPPTSSPDDSTGEPNTSATADPHEAGPPPGAEEVDEPMPRLAVADATSGAVELLDLIAGESIARFEASGPSSLSTDGRFVFATDDEGGEVTVIDSGSWVDDHGDHSHAYVAEPADLGRLVGAEPAHVVSNDGYTAVFFDGTGTSQVLAAEELAAGNLTPVETIETSSPHHGVVTALADHWIVSIPGATPDDLPIGVEVRRDGADVEASFEECPDLHGEAPFSEGVLLACADGLLWITGAEGGWDAESLAYPEGTTGQDRVWSLTHGHDVPVVAATFAESDALLVADVDSKELRRIELPVTPVAVTVDDDGEHLVTLTADGQLHLIHAATGEIEASTPVLDEIDLENETGVRPQLVAAAGRTYLSDPVAGTILEIDHLDGLRTARTFELDIEPARLALTGAP